MQPVELDSTLTALTVNRSDFPKFGEMLRAIRIWSTVPADCQSPAPSISEEARETDRRPDPPIRRAGLLLLPELLCRRRNRADAIRRGRDPQPAAPGSLA